MTPTQFTPPPFLDFANGNADFILDIAIEWLLTLTLLIFTLYSLFLFYHWFAYGTSRSTNIKVLLIYLATTLPIILALFILRPFFTL